MNFDLLDRVVVVSGGTSGIGLACALALARDGAHVAILGTDAKRMQESVALVEAAGEGRSRVLGLLVDVCEPTVLATVAESVATRLGPVWGIIACAGIGGASKAEDLSLADLNRVLAVNVGGVLSTCQAFVHGMLERRRGSIVLVGSINSFGGQPGRVHYTASKHAVVGLVKNLAIDWGRFGVRVNGIAPGPVDTPLLRRNVPPGFFARVFEDRIPLGRLARSEEIANSCLMLLSDASSFVNGAMLVVDGGMTAGPFTHRGGADMGSNRLLAAGAYEEVE
ncbi:MAG: SDR family oxidoreductase [Rhodoferax sp.]|nr:SDR family oxidoreductase [Rhodoferax sp.]